MRQKTTVIRREHFNAAHRLHNSNWDDRTNQLIFGKCNNANFHGHNYDLEVILTGEVNEDTGYVYDTKELSQLIKANVLLPYDHKNLNLDVEEFKELNPTAENIAWRIFENLRPHLNSSLDLKIRLYETERNCVEYPA